MVYLIHFEKPYKHARHYLGYTQLESVEDRLNRHRSGRGARLLQILNQNNIGYFVVRTWLGNKEKEKELKKQKKAKNLCPICNPKKWRNNK